MLAELYVADFALIEDLRVDFYRGLNIISGETGAGKSLLTDAVGLLMGNRADKELIRCGAKRALVEGTFAGPFSPGFLGMLTEAGFEVEDDTLIITREINVEGKNLCRINGRRVSLSVLNDIVPQIMNLHSQREYFAFLREDKQMAIVDYYGGQELSGAKEETAIAYRHWREAEKRLKELVTKREETEEKKDFLLYRIKEIEALSLEPGEDERLRRDIELMRTGTRRLELSDDIYGKLNDATESLYGAMEGLKSLTSMDDVLNDEKERITEAYYDVEDIGHTLSAYRDGIEADPQGLDRAESRLSEIEALLKKENTDLNGLLRRYREFKSEVESLNDYEYFFSKYQKEESDAAAVFQAKAEYLHDLRVRAGNDLSRLVEKELHDVMLPNAKFALSLEEGSLSADGGDRAVFLISMNKGETLKPLAKIASGGEMSRVFLALEIILGRGTEVEIMIFDEIDSGMGGKTAAAVAQKLAALSRGIQVFAITHSPIVASYADAHFYIEKKGVGERTNVYIAKLEGDGVKSEIARMISGDEDSAVSLSQASELLEEAGKNKIKGV